MESVPPLLDSKDSIEVLCMGCYDSKCDFRAIKMRRRVMRDEDIEIDMKYCGVCHTDLHKAAGHLDAVGIRPIFLYLPAYPVYSCFADLLTYNLTLL